MGDLQNIKIVKKSGNVVDFDNTKIRNAVSKSAERANRELTEEEMNRVCEIVWSEVLDSHLNEVPVSKMHIYVELALDEVAPEVAKCYRDYRNYKQDFVPFTDEILKFNQGLLYLADKSNANTDSAITSTKRSLLYKKVSRELYQKVFLKPEETQTIKDGYIYIHDLGDRLHCTHNCCVVDFKHLIDKGFEMSNVRYKKPKRLASLFGIIGDLTLNTSA